MNPALKGVWENIRELGLCSLAHAVYNSAYSSPFNRRTPELSVLQAAHACELIIKAKIAQEHPLLIFEQLPRSTQIEGTHLDIVDLFKQGRTIQWSDLPERLWAATGLLIPEKSKFDAFGKIRNGLQHFGPAPDFDPAYETLRFIFEVIDPFIYQCWGLCAIDYNEDHEPYIYFARTLTSLEIEFLVSQNAAKDSKEWDIDWGKLSPNYSKKMKERIDIALKI